MVMAVGSKAQQPIDGGNNLESQKGGFSRENWIIQSIISIIDPSVIV
jgi:hypothetical protein